MTRLFARRDVLQCNGFLHMLPTYAMYLPYRSIDVACYNTRIYHSWESLRSRKTKVRKGRSESAWWKPSMEVQGAENKNTNAASLNTTDASSVLNCLA